MTEIISFQKERAQKENDNKLWTPRDTLEFLLKELDAGRVKADSLALIVGERNELGRVYFGQLLLSNTTITEFIGLAELAKLHLALAGPQ